LRHAEQCHHRRARQQRQQDRQEELAPSREPEADRSTQRGDCRADGEHRQMPPHRAPDPSHDQTLKSPDCRGDGEGGGLSDLPHPGTPAVATLAMKALWNRRNTTRAGTTTAVIAAKTTTLEPLWPACRVTRPSGSVMRSSVLRKISGPKTLFQVASKFKIVIAAMAGTESGISMRNM